MTISYKTWFSVQLLHDYFNHDTFTDCMLAPAEETTAQFFSGTQWLQRFSQDTLTVLIKEDGTGLPAMQVPTDEAFRFYLICNNPTFFNYTDLDPRATSGYILYLSNFNNNKVGATLNLSTPIAAYTTYPAGKKFFPGDLVTDSGGTIYECIVRSTNNAITNTAFWLPRTTKQYVAAADLIRLSPAIYQHSFTDPIKQLDITIKGYKVTGNTLAEYDALIGQQLYAGGTSKIKYDLSTLQPGRYKIASTGTKKSDNTTITDEEVIYYDPKASFNNALGIVEIFNCIDITNPYALQSNPSKKILETAYTIGFANRTAWWNYIARTSAVTGINATVAGLTFSNPNLNEFTASAPLPLVKKFDYTPFTAAGIIQTPTLPWPSPATLKTEKDGSGAITKVFTEIYLNY